MITISFDKYENFESILLLEKLSNNNLYIEESWYFIKQTENNCKRYVKLLNNSEYERCYRLLIEPILFINQIINTQFDLYIYCNDKYCKNIILEVFDKNNIKYDIRNVGDNND